MNKSDLPESLESAPNSLECWDYSVELECLRGSEGKLFTVWFIKKLSKVLKIKYDLIVMKIVVF